MFVDVRLNQNLARLVNSQPGTVRVATAAVLQNVTAKQARNAPVRVGTLRGGMQAVVVNGANGPVILSGSRLPYARRQHYEHATRHGYLNPFT
jgi:hypothetical protein